MKTYNQINLLELTDKKNFIRKEGEASKISIHRIKNNSIDTHSLYADRGHRSFHDFKISSNYDIINNYLSLPEVHFYIGIYNNEVIGTFDFIISADNQIEIKNFGISKKSKYQDLADQWLSKAIEFSLQLEPRRIYLYLSQNSRMKKLFKECGFSYKEQTQSKVVSANKSSFGTISNFLINYN